MIYFVRHLEPVLPTAAFVIQMAVAWAPFLIVLLVGRTKR
jgi:hypothetical protein